VTPQLAKETDAAIKKAGKASEIHIYPGVDHGFFNDERPDVYNKRPPTTLAAHARVLPHAPEVADLPVGTTRRVVPTGSAAHAFQAPGPHAETRPHREPTPLDVLDSRARQGGVIDTRATPHKRGAAPRAPRVQVFGVDERVEVSDADPDALRPLLVDPRVTPSPGARTRSGGCCASRRPPRTPP